MDLHGLPGSFLGPGGLWALPLRLLNGLVVGSGIPFIMWAGMRTEPRNEFESVMTPDQLTLWIEANEELLSMLTEDQRRRLLNGEELSIILNELSAENIARISELARNIWTMFSLEQKGDLNFLLSDALDGLSFAQREAILIHLKENNGNITYDDLVRIGVYDEGQMRNTGNNFASALELEYHLIVQYRTSIAEMETIYERNLNTRRALSLMLSILPVVYGGFYGQGKVKWGDNKFDNTERYGTAERLGGPGIGGGVRNTWGNPDTLQDHFDRHGADFGSSNPQDYANRANNFYNNRGNYQVKIDQSGITRVYDANTNTFGSYNPDGTTKTFFKPTDFQSYFDRQPGN